MFPKHSLTLISRVAFLAVVIKNMCRKLHVTRLPRVVIVTVFIYVAYNYNSKSYEAKEQWMDISKNNHTRLHVILQWTNRSKAPFNFMAAGNSSFVRNNCKYTNCFVTDNRSYFRSLLNFDAIAFNGRELVYPLPFQLPQIRSRTQKYIFGAMESSDNFPVCDRKFDGYFNWTWTYKLDSDFRWGYITIYDLDGNVVGPSMNMKWPDEMKPIDENLKVKLSNKTKAAAWFVSHCSTKSRREDFVDKMQIELQRYGWTVDVYGRCGILNCSKKNWRACYRLVENEYYFYLAFENSFSEDYVTEKLLVALNNYAVPVVYGAADYSRFLPLGSFLDARKLGPEELARRMNEIIANRDMYYDFFRWRNHYRYKETSSNDDVCKLCEMMNSVDKRMQNTVWDDFLTWWNGKMYGNNC